MTRDLDMQITGVDRLSDLGADGRPSDRTKQPKPEGGVSPVLIVALLVVVGFTATMLMRKAQPPSLAAGMPEVPELLGATESCPYQGRAAGARAEEAELAALAKAERYAFDVHDGVDAVQLYSVATACYTQGGDVSSAARTRKAEESWRARMKTEYQSHRLRLRLALDRGANDDAYREAHGLRAMLRSQSGPYVEWLAAIERAYKPIEKKKRAFSRKAH
jgi:hypothetical protein